MKVAMLLRYRDAEHENVFGYKLSKNSFGRQPHLSEHGEALRPILNEDLKDNDSNLHISKRPQDQVQGSIQQLDLKRLNMNNKLPTFDLFGIQLHALSKHELVDAVAQAITSSGRCIIANHNLHSLYMWLHEPRMREFYCLADYTHIDGMSLVLLGRLLGMPLKREHRTGSREPSDPGAD
jgi:hypothetical protein